MGPKVDIADLYQMGTLLNSPSFLRKAHVYSIARNRAFPFPFLSFPFLSFSLSSHLSFRRLRHVTAH